MRVVILIILSTLLSAPCTSAAWELSSYAFVNDDGTLRIRKRTVHLYGIIIPPTDITCRTYIRPIKCAPRAALALDFKIGAHFVHCQIHHRNPDDSLTGTCYADEKDLAAYLLERGWAAAHPVQAPPEYVVLEKIARNRSVGVWGIPVDRVIRPPQAD